MRERRGDGAYVTWVCDCKPPKPLDRSKPCPRHCGNGRPVLKLKPRLFARTWPTVEIEQREPFPAPVVPAVVVELGDPRVGRSARTLATLAVANGWHTVVSYAEGWVPHGTHGRPTSVDPKPSILVRGKCSCGRQFAAQWIGSACDTSSRRLREAATNKAPSTFGAGGPGRGRIVEDAELRSVIRECARHHER